MTAFRGEVAMVSVIIPTYRRPELARRAAETALAQNWPAMEVLVVSDGPDPATRALLEDLDPRLRYLELEHNQGPAAARNAGVAASRGEWITFLDDDDLMLPEKVSVQMRLADPSQPTRMVACRAVYRHGAREDIWPSRVIAAEEDLADYLLLRKSLGGRPGIVSLQMLLMHHSLARALPFRSHEDHEDWAWLLEAWFQKGARIEFVWQPLVIYTIDTEGESRSRRMNWQASLCWAREHRSMIGDRAYCSFLATKAALKAKRAGDWRGLQELTGEILRNRPGLLEIVFLLAILAAPKQLLHRAWKRTLRSVERGTESRLEPAISQSHLRAPG